MSSQNYLSYCLKAQLFSPLHSFTWNYCLQLPREVALPDFSEMEYCQLCSWTSQPFSSVDLWEHLDHKAETDEESN